MSADLIARLITAGVAAELVAEVAMALAEATVQASVSAEAHERRKQNDRARTERYRARGGGQVLGWMRQEIFERDGFQCCECAATDRLEIDHIIPLMKGGSNDIENLQTLCRICNARKRDRIRKSDKRGQERTGADNHGQSRTTADIPAPSPPPLSSPQTPQQTPPPHPHPDGFNAYTRGLAVRVVLAAIEAGCRSAIDAGRKPGKPRWPRTMPPPVGVSDDQWAGFIAHRKAKRSALTDHAYGLLVAKLERHASDEWPPGRVVDTTIERSWLSFEPEWLTRQDARNGKRTHQDRPSGPIEARRRDRERFEVESGPGDGGC